MVLMEFLEVSVNYFRPWHTFPASSLLFSRKIWILSYFISLNDLKKQAIRQWLKPKVEGGD